MAKRNEKVERNNLIFQQREKGDSYRKISEDHGISIIRVRQIIEAERRKISGENSSEHHNSILQHRKVH